MQVPNPNLEARTVCANLFAHLFKHACNALGIKCSVHLSYQSLSWYAAVFFLTTRLSPGFLKGHIATCGSPQPQRGR